MKRIQILVQSENTHMYHSTLGSATAEGDIKKEKKNKCLYFTIIAKFISTLFPFSQMNSVFEPVEFKPF